MSWCGWSSSRRSREPSGAGRSQWRPSSFCLAEGRSQGGRGRRPFLSSRAPHSLGTAAPSWPLVWVEESGILGLSSASEVASVAAAAVSSVDSEEETGPLALASSEKGFAQEEEAVFWRVPLEREFVSAASSSRARWAVIPDPGSFPRPSSCSKGTQLVLAVQPPFSGPQCYLLAN